MSFRRAVAALLKALRLKDGLARDDKQWKIRAHELRTIADTHKINTRRIQSLEKGEVQAGLKDIETFASHVELIIEADKRAFGRLASRKDGWEEEYDERENLSSSLYWGEDDALTWEDKAEAIVEARSAASGPGKGRRKRA